MTTTATRCSRVGMMRLLGLVVVVASVAPVSLHYMDSKTNDHTTRRLEDVDSSYFEYDLSEFHLRFDRCQSVKMYDDDLADNQDSDTVLATRPFVLFTLCPTSSSTNSQDTCGVCQSNVHGEYALQLDDYLDGTVEYLRERFEAMCENCFDWCNDDDSSCCGNLCYQYDNLEANGLVDATEYLECQQVEMNNDGSSSSNEQDESDNLVLYMGPKCTQDTTRIVIGLFSDENCVAPYTEQSVQEVLGIKLSYILLQQAYSSNDGGGTMCLSCAEQGNNNANDNADADNVNDMCETLYAASAKCESPYGIQAGFVQTKQDDGEYENQVENEFMACAFVNNIKYNSYTETGEIDLKSEQDEVIRYVTPLQISVLTLLVATVVCLGTYGYRLDREIGTKHATRVDLSHQSDHPLT